MNKELLIFGAYGALGRGATEVLIKKNFDKIYLFGSRIAEENVITAPNVENILVQNLSVETNVITAFSKIKPGKDKLLFLFSTVGGYTGGKYLWEIDEQEWDRMFNMNLKTNFFIAKHFAKLVKESVGGSLCVTSAYTGSHAEAKKASYGISKSALNHLVKTLALEGKEIKLSVNAIAPFIIDTPDNRQRMTSGDYSKWIKPAEIGELVLSLFENYNFVSGEVVELRERFEG